MGIDDILPKKVVRSLLVVAIIIIIGLLLNHEFGDDYIQWRENKGSEGAERQGEFSTGMTEWSVPVIEGKPLTNQDGPLKGHLNESQPERLSVNELRQLEYQQGKWKKSRGYFEQEDYDQYATLDTAALWQLAEEGDLLALDILANQADAAGDREEATAIRWTAAAYGSTSALNDLVNMSEVMRWGQDLSAEGQKRAAMSMLTFAEISAMRGDRTGVWSSLMNLKGSKITFSDKEVASISSSAKRLYSELEAKRVSLGLDSFENGEDPLTELQLDYMISVLPKPSGWAATKYAEPENQVAMASSAKER